MEELPFYSIYSRKELLNKPLETKSDTVIPVKGFIAIHSVNGEGDIELIYIAVSDIIGFKSTVTDFKSVKSFIRTSNNWYNIIESVNEIAQLINNSYKIYKKRK